MQLVDAQAHSLDTDGLQQQHAGCWVELMLDVLTLGSQRNVKLVSVQAGDDKHRHPR